MNKKSESHKAMEVGDFKKTVIHTITLPDGTKKDVKVDAICCTAKINAAEFERAKSLLAIDDFSLLSEQEKEHLGVEEDSNRILYSAAFPDGTKLDMYLRSGQSNYYTEAEIQRPGEEVSSIMNEAAYGKGVSETDYFIIGGSNYRVDIQLV